MLRRSFAAKFLLQPPRFARSFFNTTAHSATPPSLTLNNQIENPNILAFANNIQKQLPLNIQNDYLSKMQKTPSNLLVTETETWHKIKKHYDNTTCFMQLLSTKYSFSFPQCLLEINRLLSEGVIFDPAARKKIIEHAVMHDNAGILKQITENQLKANSNFNSIAYWTEKNEDIILSMVAKGHGLNVLQFFIDYGYNVNTLYYEPLEWNLLLELANHITHEGHLKLLDLLLRKGAKVNVEDADYCYTPLKRAIHFSYKKNPQVCLAAIKLLLKYGADPALSDIWHDTAFYGYYDIINYFLTADYPKKIDINLKDSNGCNAAHIVLRKKNKTYKDLEMIQLLIKKGIDTSAKDNKGFSVTDYLKELAPLSIETMTGMQKENDVHSLSTPTGSNFNL
ncbi:MAG: hypothetical protein A3F18_05160 [Legionellales bacterium RIFCSPHIGHO2_12_FULL_37_14]|nr:MAG: hypothetical protein A3F18_05160 [Legionellales bacterium RIFCSPHIGHO2_12_FULL_37_14]